MATPQVPRSIDGEPVESAPLTISMGCFEGVTHVNKFGAITNVGTSFEDVWAQGGTWTPLAAATTLAISSSSANDDVSGSGALTFTVSGLDANGLEIEETITLTGQTPVITTKVFSAVNRAFVLTSGTAWAANEGDIYVADDATAHTAGVPDTAALIQAHISVQDGQTQLAHYTVPAGKTAFLTSIYVLSGDNKTVTFEFYRYSDVQVKRIVFAGTVTNINFTKDYEPYVTIQAGWIINCRAKVAVGTALVAAGFDMVLVDNDRQNP